MYILGIYYGHNSTATILKNGQILAAASEERFTNIKNFKGFPKNAISYVLKTAGIDSTRLDLVTISFKTLSPVHSVSQTDKSSSTYQLLILSKPFQTIRSTWGWLAFQFPFFKKIGQIFYFLTVNTICLYTRYQETSFLA